MISVEKYIEVRELPIKDLLKFIEKWNENLLFMEDRIVFTRKNWKVLKSRKYSTLGDLFDGYQSYNKYKDTVTVVNKMIINYLDISVCNISEVSRKVLPRGEEVKILPNGYWRPGIVYDMADPNLILVIQQIIDDMEEKRKALEASTGGETT